MPNWCNNNLVVTGDKKERDAFVQRVTLSPEAQKERGQYYEILAQLYPTPQELIETRAGVFADEEEQKKLKEKQKSNVEKYGQKDWYDWNIARWGTKWSDSETFMDAHDDEMTVFSFQSAWSPPCEGIAHISEMFPNLTFVLTYDEAGMGFFGAMKARNGEYVNEERSFENIPDLNDVDWDDNESISRYHEAIDNAKDALYSVVL